jgi:glucosamine kinase
MLNRKLLVAESGSTKTSWFIIQGEGDSAGSCRTSGINPFLQSEEEISGMLQKEFTLSRGYYSKVYFYGAGCGNPEKVGKIKRLLEYFFKAGEILVDSDLMAAARSLCGSKPGIAAIIGTGSNCCYYDGVQINRHVPPLGYILGDEGSGAVLGRKLLADILKNRLPGNIITDFFLKYKTDQAEILDNIYRKPFPNRYMAEFTHFIADNIDDPSIHSMVKESFADFFVRNISQLPESSWLPVNLTGSIAWHFRSILTQAALETGFSTGIITGSPADGLLEYHIKQFQI